MCRGLRILCSTSQTLLIWSFCQHFRPNFADRRSFQPSNATCLPSGVREKKTKTLKHCSLPKLSRQRRAKRGKQKNTWYWTVSGMNPSSHLPLLAHLRSQLGALPGGGGRCGMGRVRGLLPRFRRGIGRKRLTGLRARGRRRRRWRRWRRWRRVLRVLRVLWGFWWFWWLIRWLRRLDRLRGQGLLRSVSRLRVLKLRPFGPFGLALGPPRLPHRAALHLETITESARAGQDECVGFCSHGTRGLCLALRSKVQASLTKKDASFWAFEC